MAKIGLSFTILVLVMAAVPALADSLPHLEWVYSYDSPAQGSERGRDAVVDDDGNVYAVGSETRSDLQQLQNILIKKFAPDGSVLWTSTYDGPDHREDLGYGIALDAGGNVYVTGYQRDSDLLRHVWLRKYNPQGGVLWTNTYNSPGYEGTVGEFGQGVAIDSEANLYVTGYSVSSDSMHSLFLHKFDADGGEIWKQQYADPGYDHISCAVEADSQGNVYVAGYRKEGFFGEITKPVFQKYDTDGNLLWSKTDAVFADGCKRINDIDIDGEDNVIMTGYEMVEGSDSAIFIGKYDSDGENVWRTNYNTPSDFVPYLEDCGYGVTVDDMDDVYVTGRIGYFFMSSNQGSIFIGKYSGADASTIWETAYALENTTRDIGYSIAVDDAGNVYVTGVQGNTGTVPDDFVLLKYAQIPEPSTILLMLGSASSLAFAAGTLRKRIC